MTKAGVEDCDIYLNNMRYRFDAWRRVYLSASGLEPKVVSMEDVSLGRVHVALTRAYVIGEIPYYFDDQRRELSRIGRPDACFAVDGYEALLGAGQVSAPIGAPFKAIVDRELMHARLSPDRERER